MTKPTIKVAVVQDGGDIFNTEKTLLRLEEWCEKAASDGAELVVFPEAYLGGYPKGEDFGIRLGTRSPEGRAYFSRYFDSAVEQGDKIHQQLSKIAKRYKLQIVTGIVEKVGSTLHCAAWFFNDEGLLIGVHRKLMPTALERCIWGFGDGSTIPVVDTPLGKLGAAICWENYMPLYRNHLYQQGIEIYCAPTVDEREQWQSTIKHIAVEGRCFMLSSCQYMTTEHLPNELQPEETKTLIRGGSTIISPLGDVLVEPIYDQTGMITAELDRSLLAQGRFDLDVVGHYSRPDVFNFSVDTTKRF